MKINDALMKQIAVMAAIEMDSAEAETQRQDLERIAVFTEKLAELDTDGLPEQTHPFGSDEERTEKGAGSNRLREDKVTNKDCAEEMVAAAPDSKGLYLRTPRTVEE